MKVWLGLLAAIALLGYAVVTLPGCATILKPDPNNCAAHPNASGCLAPINDWGDNPSTMSRRPDAGATETKGTP